MRIIYLFIAIIKCRDLKSTAKRVVFFALAMTCATFYSEITNAQNLISNPGFESGNTDFSSDYQYTTAPNGLVDEGRYAVGSNANYYHGAFTGSPQSGSLFFIANGGSDTNDAVWLTDELIQVTEPGIAYRFEAYVSTVYPVSEGVPGPDMEFELGDGTNWISLGATVEFIDGDTAGTWKFTNADGKFNTAGNYYLRLRNNQTAEGGNDFGVDTLYFGLASESPSIDTKPVDPGTPTFDTDTLDSIPNIDTSQAFFTVDDVINNNVGRVFDGGTLQVDAAQSGANLSGNFTVQNTGGTIDTAGRILTISGNIYDGSTLGGTSSLIKTGAGILTLTGTNTYTGGTTISGGTLRASADNNLGASSGGLTFDGGTFQYENGFTSNRAVTITSNGGTIYTNGNNASLTGNLTGDGTLTKTGTGALTLSGTNSYTGGTSLSGGTTIAGHDNAFGSAAVTITGNSSLQSNDNARSISNALTINSGQTLNVSGSNNLALAGNIDGAGTLTKTDAGALTLSGTNSYSGATSVSAGKLVVNGTLSNSTATIASAATLGGNATIANLINNGTVAPGNSIGTINVTGDFTATNGSTTEIEINGKISGAGQCDLIAITGGATIDSGATLKVIPVDTIITTEDYKFMTTGNGITGEYTILDTALIDFTSEIRGNDYYLTVAVNPFTGVAQTQNQMQIASYLERTYSSASTDYQNVVGQMQGLATDDEVRNAMDQLDGELFPTLSIANLQATSNFIRTIGDQLRPGVGGFGSNGFANASLEDGMLVRAQNGCCNQWTGWTTGYGLGGAAYSDANAHGYSYSTGGMVLGIDRQLDDRSRFGLLYGNGFASAHLDGLAANSSINSHVFGAYLKRRYDNSYSTTVFDMGFDDYQSSRRITFGAIDRTAQSKHNGWQSTLYQEVGRTLRLRRNTYLQPYAALQYIYIRQNDFTETGANSVNLQVASQDLNSLRSILGGRLIVNRSLPWLGNSELAFRTHWMHELLKQTTGLVTPDLAGGGAPGFGVRGVDLGRDWVVLGPEVMWQYHDHIQLRAAYDLTFNANQAYHTGGGSVTFTW